MHWIRHSDVGAYLGFVDRDSVAGRLGLLKKGMVVQCWSGKKREKKHQKKNESFVICFSIQHVLKNRFVFLFHELFTNF